MYYCRSCGTRSQNEFCTNPKCSNNRYGFERNLIRSPISADHGKEYSTLNNSESLSLNINHRNMPETIESSHIMDTMDECNVMDLRDNNDTWSPMPKEQTEKCKMPMVPCNEQLQLAFAQVPFQKFEYIHPVSKALISGTIFSALDMPYTQRKKIGGY